MKTSPSPQVPVTRVASSNGAGSANILYVLMLPMLMMVLNMTMFGVALPTLRDSFNIAVDTTAWLETAYALPMMIFMPLYGRLGDGLGKRRLFMLGIGVFITGSLIVFLSVNLPMAMVGRMIQGVGASGVNPLCIAIISERFSVPMRGKALGTWNSAGPIGGLAGPLLGGFFIDYFGWRTIFVVAILLGVVALLAVKTGIPAGNRDFIEPRYLQSFDWVGVLLLTLGAAGVVFFTSSRPITGVNALQDWRLLGAGLFFLAVFVGWEKNHANPFVPLPMFRHKTFVLASLLSGLRMWTLVSAGFLNTLYLTDVWFLSAVGVGAIKMVLAIGLLITMRLGGTLADRWDSRRPIMIGLTGQGLSLLLLALLPASAALVWVIVLFALHGLSAGMSLAALHRAALAAIAPGRLGIASGLYGMIRFAGMVIGVALVGVLLEAGLNYFGLPLQAYRLAYTFTGMVALSGALLCRSLNEPASLYNEELGQPG